MGRLALRFVVVLVLALVIGLGLFFWGYGSFTRPGPLSAPTTLIIPAGSGLEDIARLLEEAGVIDTPVVFLAAARITEASRSLKAGEYELKPGVSPREVMEKMARGETVVRRITVPEGLTTHQVVELVRRTEGLAGEIADMPSEGWLLPETYHFSYGDHRKAIVARMEEAMRRTIDELWNRRAGDLPVGTPEEAVILASIVEKETGREDERPRVAAVFLNRLRRGMKLDADPTVAFAVTNGTGAMDRPLTRRDLAYESPYNTYLNVGLPPGPIANPGRASLAAVLNPAVTDELFFVADGSGGHAFARTYEEHQRNVQRWRELRRRQESGGSE